MHLDTGAVRITAVVVVFALLYGSRLTKGSVKETSEGLVFAMKPFVIVARVATFLLYLGFFGHTLLSQAQSVPIWFPLVFIVAVVFILIQLPGTIMLGPDAVTQRFWLLKTKRIGYAEVMTIQASSAGRAIRVLGDNRTVITHTNNHSAAETFRAELERRTGKRQTS